jgi:hypothetical protein
MKLLMYGAAVAMAMVVSTAGSANQVTKQFACMPVAGNHSVAYPIQCVVRWGQSYVQNCTCESGFALVDVETILPPPSPNNATDG